MEDHQKREVALTNPDRKPSKSPSPTSHSAPPSSPPPDPLPASGDDSDGSADFPMRCQCSLDVHAFLASFPPGYRFKPYDDELVIHYLKRRISNKRLPANKISEVELYKFNPETLAANYEHNGEKEWYFFTPRDRKYRHGDRPNRAAGDGYWKATGADRAVISKDVKVGYRKALVFYKGKPPRGDKTDWIMHEFRVDNPPKKERAGNDMRLDDWVLCRIYKKIDRSSKAGNRPARAAQSLARKSDDQYLIPEESKPPPVILPSHGTNHQMGYLNGHGSYGYYQNLFNGGSSTPPMDIISADYAVQSQMMRSENFEEFNQLEQQEFLSSHRFSSLYFSSDHNMDQNIDQYLLNMGNNSLDGSD